MTEATPVPPEGQGHGLHRGMDLKTDSDFVKLFTYCRGNRFTFSICGENNNLMAEERSDRVKLSSQPKQCVFIQSTCLTNLGASCVGVVAAIQLKENHPWKFCIVNCLHDFSKNCIDVLEFFEWTGSLEENKDGSSCPACFHCNNWEDMKSHFTLKSYPCSEINQVFFLNQISGKAPLNGRIHNDVYNEVDGGIQCSMQGPDKWPITKPNFVSNLGMSFDDFALKEGDTGHQDILVQRKYRTRTKKRKNSMKTLLSKEENKDALKFEEPPNYIPRANRSGLVVVVEVLGRPIKPLEAKKIPDALEATINFGSITTAEAPKNCTQRFYCLSSTQRDKLVSDYPNGIELSNNFEEEIDDVLSRYATHPNSQGITTRRGKRQKQEKSQVSSHELVSIGRLSKLVPENPEGDPLDFVRIFGGDGAPTVDDTFQRIHHDGLEINFKIANAREYSGYTPLSIGLFQSSFHQLRIQSSIIDKITACLGTSGLYPKRLSNVSRGHNSYIGQRKSNKLSTPTVSEGPCSRKSSKPKESGFVFFRQSIKTLLFPFVLSLMNYLINSISIAPYYFFHHLAVLYPIRNNDHWHIRFCSIAIITIDFCCSCHVDSNDLEDWAKNDMINRLKKIIEQFSFLENAGVEMMMKNHAIQSLKHIQWWGLCTPTSCCYQYVKERNDITVYQWFMLPGLGLCYRIENYWIHIMLAALFSHCTSDAIYIKKGKAFFGKCDEVTMFAWGGG
ncbi:hypothetical protein QTG54_015776 [Skeletonema marinoi]|uniref:Uncharacterized protein n=1 Tax=Skeletonema marinoi TaxID=267567 RepID=A0AAD8XU52_9STRA|nr:hypothetical protein QTG54_015776 [Skeletonema marinoi]